MNDIYRVILENNFRNVVTIKNRNFDVEKLEPGPVNIKDVINGMSELNKNGLTLLVIHTGNSEEGITKIKNIEDFGYREKLPTVPDDLTLPENDIIPYKSDSWILGEFIIKQKTGKKIPKRFLKSQKLLDTFIGEDEILKKLLVIDHEKRFYTWEIFPNEEKNMCTIQ